MKKDLIKALVAIGVCTIVVLVGVFAFNLYMTKDEAKNYTADCERYGYVKYWDDKYPEESTVLLVKTYEEYEQCREDILNGGSVAKQYKEKLESYNETFFETKDLILEYYVVSSGSVEIKFNRLDVRDGVANVVISKIVPDKGSADMAYWATFVEVSKDNGIVSVE